MSGKPPTQDDKARIQRTQVGKDEGFASRIQSSADKAAYEASKGAPTQADKARIQSTQAGKDDGGFASRIQSSADKAAYQASQGNQSK